MATTPEPTPAGGPTGALTQEERNWAMFCHLGALAGFFIPFANIIAPLVLWLVKREESAFIDEQGKESLNFQITMTIAAFISMLLIIIVVGFFLLLAVGIFSVVMIIIAAIKTNGGEHYRYPLCIRFIK